MTPIRVETSRTLAALAPRRAEINALNLASRRPCPFSTFEYLETFLAHDEYEQPGDEPLFLLGLEGDRLAGFLPLRRRHRRWRGLPYQEIELLLTHDTDRPRVLARGEDEARCAALFYEHLLTRERGWSALELAMQDAESPLLALPPLSRLRFHARRFENMPNTTMPLPPSFEAYFGRLHRRLRKHLVTGSRDLLRAGKVEVVTSADPRARLRLLELYLDLEKRSWKERAGAGIGRHPRRVELFRSLCGPDQPMQLIFDFLLLDDLPIAGMINGAFAGGYHGLETLYDAAYEHLTPGHFLFLSAIRREIEAGVRSHNVNGNYAYYKARLGGTVTPTWAVQIYRVGTVPWLKARLGELKRALRPPAEQAEFNPARREVEDAGGGSSPADRAQLRERTRALLRAFEEERLDVQRLAGAEFPQVRSSPTTQEAA